jgi:alkylhydroperoxidase family enzyme
MSLLKTVEPGKATGDVKRLYDMFTETVGMVPEPLVMFSASPGLLAIQEQMVGYYQNDSSLDPMLMALIRYLTAVTLGLKCCIEFNSEVLKKLGMNEEEITALADNPGRAPIKEKEGWLLALVVIATRTPERVTQSHIDNLHNHGWTDTDILDALFIVARMTGVNLMMKALGFAGGDDEGEADARTGLR